jgi:histidine triad (HIT) family protein
MSTSIKKGVVYSASGDMMSCLFCNIIAGTEPATVITQNEKYIVFQNIRPVSKTAHYLVSPKDHIHNLTALSGQAGANIVTEMVEVS